MNPLVSVVVPVYKTEKYIRNCILSVINQTYSNLEILLIDDGSPDNCPQICEEYANSDNRISVVHKKNGGLSDARNRGIEIASGEYITFLDSDDVIGPHMIESMTSLILKESADIVKMRSERTYTLADCVESDGPYTCETSISMLKRIYHDQPQIISACGKLFKTELFSKIRFPVGLYYEDEFTTPKIYATASKIVVSDSLEYFYMQWDNESIMRSKQRPKKIRDAIAMSEDRITFFEQLGNEDLILLAKEDHYYRLKRFVDGTHDASDEDLKREINKKLITVKKAYPLLVARIESKQFLYRLKTKLLGGLHE